MTKKQVQQALAGLGLYKGAIDGIHGPITKHAIKTFQRRKELTVDGIAGPQTWAALRGDDPPVTTPSGRVNARSERNLKGVHPDLQRVMRRALSEYHLEVTITEGLRTLERQRHLMSIGASRTLNSRHLTGHAVDIVFIMGKEARWDWPLYKAFSDAVKRIAREEKVPIVWGGDWKSFKDGPHFELDRRVYP
jgi:peptidoglycan LD-endopeptidase CwlK